MTARLIGEPELEFRTRNRHIDPRYGVAVYGPADADSPSAPRDISVGLVGPAAAIDGMRGWLDRGRTQIEAKEAKPGQENLHQPFPGFSTDTSFGAGLVFDDALVREIPERQLRLLAKADVKAAIAEGADMYADAAQSLAETGRCRVILCDRRPYLTEADARKLLSDALAEYRRTHGHQPARIVLHKSSQLSPAQVSGFQGAPSVRLDSGLRAVLDGWLWGVRL